MKTKIFAFGLFFLIAVLSFSGCTQQEKAVEKKPKNIILLIGDGMGLAQVHAAMTVNHNRLNMERCPFIGLSKTWSASDYVTDSGAGGTAIATGSKTRNGSVSVDTAGKPLKTILEYSEENGLATGLTVTCEVTHATPAVFTAHNISRNDHEGIAVDILKSGMDVFIGGGRDYFNNRKDSADLVKDLRDAGYEVCITLDQVKASGSAKIAGLLYEKKPPRIHEGREGLLESATLKALEILSLNTDGFFLMVEGSQIDWGGHDNDQEYIVEETLEFDRVVGIALDFAEKNGETLVIVTADHETGGMTINNGNYETGEVETAFTSGDHTGVMVPVFAYGPGAGMFSGIYENTAIFDKMIQAFGFEIFNKQ
ncbi:MAG: alkaline phosphatase [Bacteroidales bacterium]|nr:alkaline phosphatase [Bacteroidales bacterium]